MDVVVWTSIFVGGDVLILAFLMFWAAKKDREKALHGGDADETA